MADRAADLALVAAARRGDRGAFTRLHARYGRVVHAVLLARVPANDADDLVQDVFLTAWRRLGDLHEDGAFGGWLCTVARNAAVDFLRARRLHEPLVDEVSAVPPPVAEAREALAAIRALPEAYRETLLMPGATAGSRTACACCGCTPRRRPNPSSRCRSSRRPGRSSACWSAGRSW